MRPGSRTLASIVLCAALLIGACGDDTSGPGDNDNARLTIRLTDAPGDVKAAVVTISEIYLQGGGEGRTVVSDAAITTDLVTLANTATVIVDQADIPSGTYQELRFVITGGYLEVEDDVGGSRFFASSADYAGLPAGVVPDGELVMPSLGTSGLKVDFDGALVLDGEHEVLVDFDVAQSFGHEAGNSGRWIMHPVIRGAWATQAASLRVSLALGDGVVLPELGGVAITLANFRASLDNQQQPFVSGSSGFQAVYQYRLPGSYAVTIIGPLGLSFVTEPAGPQGVTLTAGQEATAAFTITGVNILPGG